MAKQEPGNNIETSTGNREGANAPLETESQSAEEMVTRKTEVKNAHASGDGSIGRSDEDLSANESSSERSGF
ncbi:MAG TPA: hypothetical protein VNR87_08840 [Flavisolibacter sp.]|nr:hypothetical protein [Flavisolibacter sp.]